MRKKFILVLALVAAFGLGCGRLTEDLCACGGSFADDPSTPVGITELALPSHTQSAQKAVAPATLIEALLESSIRLATAADGPEQPALVAPSLPVPIRC